MISHARFIEILQPELWATRLLVAGLITICGVSSGCSNQPSDASAKDEMTRPTGSHAQPQTQKTAAGPQGSRTDDSAGVTWFSDPADLPESHPCHASAVVVEWRLKAPLKGDSADDNGPTLEWTTLGALREGEAADVGVDSLSVRGVRWHDADGEHLVATCNLSGGGIREFKGILLDNGDEVSADRAQYLVDYIGEINDVERGDLRQMHRGSDGEWDTLDLTVLWRNNDESNEPHYVARAELVGVEDADQNGQPELVAFTLRDTRGTDEPNAKAICPAENHLSRCRVFEVILSARQGGEILAQRVVLRVDGAMVSVGEFVRPGTMGDDAFDTLKAALETHRDAALEQARATLRDAKKLAEAP